MNTRNSAADTESLFRLFNSISPLRQSVTDKISSYLREDHLPKKSHILRAGGTCTRIWFIKNGFARVYYLDEDGLEHTTWFMGDDTLMISVFSFFTQQPSYENIELLEASELLSISWQQLQAIYAEYPEFNYHGRILTQNYYMQSESRSIMLRSRSAEDRYIQLLQIHPKIFEQTSVTQIASYLRTTRETLSRIRNERARSSNKPAYKRNNNSSNPLLLWLFVFCMLLFNACRKDVPSALTKQNISIANDTISLNQAKEAFNQIRRQRTAENISHLTSSSNDNWEPDWETSASFSTKDRGNYWLADIPGQPNYQGFKQGYRKFAVARDSTGNLITRVIEIIPDAAYLQKKQDINTSDFTGRVFIYDMRKQLVAGRIFFEGRQVGEIRNQATDQVKKSSASLQTNLVQVSENCAWVNNNYIDADGLVHIFSERVCVYSVYDDGFYPDGGTGGGGGSSGGDPIGGGGGSAGSSAPPGSNLPGQTNSKIDPKKYTKCFSNLPDIGSKFTVTVYVQEPAAGLPFNVGPNSVGHTAIGLTKSYHGESVTQVIGFYPDATGKDKLNTRSKLVDNSDLPYTVSISYGVIGTEFNRILDFINTPPLVYNVYNYNCTNFVADACLNGGIKIPNAIGNVGLMQNGATPAALGQSIRDIDDLLSTNTNGGQVEQTNGPCN